ncbi:MAG: hypothetical protein A2599_00075 [Candidatus Staskawiczbacteria bacterium RIFOXYD1_FULL_39_28]|uniref:Uncharacterized protein n=1 Tax=Candidatus Staskawiczbacteria bacterium RIFOXYC1_FULL_38_18 TaxID=1802229 RepID=A0A1G2JAI6_9BACT|nr:MAG: hypothetical protein A2401_03580 [Candidatus Staskawiczbacteria bacterium RIFOXYC1_FULL_38_18]OGZ92216.1 MAG: hypothetical protein A2599_00075 [Candidatus Staskawiczbacteria bacterium RIFOXYD1_FULL_39_28]
MSEQRCGGCGKKFQQNDSDRITSSGNALGREPDKQLCYNCALEKVTGGSCPEEGDFNTARLISGEMTDQEWRWLQEDMRAVEESRSIIEPDSDDEDDYYNDPAWCYRCNRDTAFCKCICYECGELLEECECHCALCDTPKPGGGLCETHAPGWNESVQGPVPSNSEEVGQCEGCGITFNIVFEIESEFPTPSKTMRFLSRHNRKKCLKCS